MDNHTPAIVLGIINVLQIIAFSLQYRTNKVHHGIGWWLLWSAATALGFAFTLLRDVVPVEWISDSILLTNVLLFSGHIFLYIGIIRFFDRKENPKRLLSIFSIFILSTIYVLYLNRMDSVRPTILYGNAAIISFLAAHGLCRYQLPSVRTSANFLAAVFISCFVCPPRSRHHRLRMCLPKAFCRPQRSWFRLRRIICGPLP